MFRTVHLKHHLSSLYLHLAQALLQKIATGVAVEASVRPQHDYQSLFASIGSRNAELISSK